MVNVVPSSPIKLSPKVVGAVNLACRSTVPDPPNVPTAAAFHSANPVDASIKVKT